MKLRIESEKISHENALHKESIKMAATQFEDRSTTKQQRSNTAQSFMFACMLVTTMLTFNTCDGKVKNDSKVFLLVLDGFVHDYQRLTTNLTNLERISENGVKAERVIPSFPSDTWPTMTSLNTGLYTESHGIIKNKIFNEKLNLTFDLNDPDLVDHYGRFFTKEPLWLTNQKQGGKSSVYRWPGHLAFDEKPVYHENSSHVDGKNFTLARQAIEETFDHLKNDSSLNFMVVYLDEPDPVGHAYGVNSSRYRETIEQVDKDIIGYIQEKLQPYPNTDFIIVADHGMADLTDNVTTVLYTDDYLDNDSYVLKGFEMIEPTLNHTVDELWKNLTKLNDTGVVEIYRKDDPKYDFPSRLHYKDHPLIAPILILPKPNWRIAKSRKSKNLTFTKGQHGFDVKYTEMSTIFFATGPSFKKNVTVDPIESVNLVPLIAHILGIKAQPNNGTLKVFEDVLAVKSLGKHVNEQAKLKQLTEEQNKLNPIPERNGPDGLSDFTRFIYY